MSAKGILLAVGTTSTTEERLLQAAGLMEGATGLTEVSAALSAFNRGLYHRLQSSAESLDVLSTQFAELEEFREEARALLRGYFSMERQGLLVVGGIGRLLGFWLPLFEELGLKLTLLLDSLHLAEAASLIGAELHMAPLQASLLAGAHRLDLLLVPSRHERIYLSLEKLSSFQGAEKALAEALADYQLLPCTKAVRWEPLLEAVEPLALEEARFGVLDRLCALEEGRTESDPLPQARELAAEYAALLFTLPEFAEATLATRGEDALELKERLERIGEENLQLFDRAQHLEAVLDRQSRTDKYGRLFFALFGVEYFLAHYSKFYQKLRIYKSGLFDFDYYRSQLDRPMSPWAMVGHYVREGAGHGLNPNPYFDNVFYLSHNPDLADKPYNPLFHYLLIGERDGLRPSAHFSPTDYVKANQGRLSPRQSPLAHFLQRGEAQEQVLEEMTLLSGKALHEDRLATDEIQSLAKVIAFYLPQFHPIPENDEWWGKGFTEWRNVAKARPLFRGHYQPHEPADLGYYDLRNIEVMTEQVELAKAAGVHGFCFYYYWFSGKRLLERPVNNYLEHKEVDFPFCFCWANENWSRRWDGRDNDMLIEQKYHAEDPKNFIEDIAESLKDPRYIRVEGKPLLIVYRPSSLPNAAKIFQQWREQARAMGLGELHLAMVQFDNYDPGDYGLDAAVEFPPHQLTGPNLGIYPAGLDPRFNGLLFDYSQIASVSSAKRDEGYVCYKGVTLGWDNTARKGVNGNVVINYTPGRYQRWLSAAVHDKGTTQKGQEPLVFVNAWNEWAEGTHLEPDQRYGYAQLNATRRALARPKGVRILVVAHIFYIDLLEPICELLEGIGQEFDLAVTTPREHYFQVYHSLNMWFPNSLVSVMPVENRGRDIAPFFGRFKSYYQGYDLVCKIHSKKSLYAGGLGNWRDALFNALLGSAKQVERILGLFEENPRLGIVYPEYTEAIKGNIEWGSNYELTKGLMKRIGWSIEPDSLKDIAAGSMFWFRPEAIKPLLDLELKTEDFPQEAGQIDGTLAHAIERAFLLVCEKQEYEYLRV